MWGEDGGMMIDKIYRDNNYAQSSLFTNATTTGQIPPCRPLPLPLRAPPPILTIPCS